MPIFIFPAPESGFLAGLRTVFQKVHFSNVHQPSISDYYEEFECVYPLHSAFFVCVPVLYARKNCVIHEAVIIM